MSSTNFSWNNLKKPIVALAPMSGISDSPMRLMAKKFGSDIEFSEFISAAGLFYKEENEKSFALAQFVKEERPYIIQLFGNDPSQFKVATKILAAKFKPDGFDINFGCPAHSVVNSGAGSALFCQPQKAKEIIETVKEASGGLPTSIKLRAAYKKIPAAEFISKIEGSPFENVTLHMRTYEQLHTGEPNWDAAKELKKLLHVPLIINGGINSGEKAKAALAYTGADGVMIAQASLGNPFIFREIKAVLNGEPIPITTLSERINTALEHANLMVQTKGAKHGVIEMRKHLSWYFKGYPNVSELRSKLVRVNSLEELEQTLRSVVTA
ncbi:MAG: tRNA dihydrouridine synthase DusB [Candidatus Doudnabacteria bacterium]